MSSTQRHRFILDTLANQGSARIDELAEALNVSTMTVHRDLDQLARAGQLRKVRGGATLVTDAMAPDDRCLACYKPLDARTQVTLHWADGTQRRACCPHCGLMVVGRGTERIVGVLATDFLFGRSINARAATYLAAPAIAVCCTPTVLAFEDAHYAQRFQAGFGGELFDLNGAIAFVRTSMHL